jgi:hypothetical protein
MSGRGGLKILAFVGVFVLLPGCSSIGPKAIPRDRFDYSTALGESWKQQTLLNIVKLRYTDMPVFVDVASIVSGYSVETSVNVGGELTSSSATDGNILFVGGSGTFTDRPTITYVPMTGERFLHGLLTPIDPKNIFFMLQAGYPADFLLGLTVESLNGARNRASTGGEVREADPEFTRALQLMREIQVAGAVGIRVKDDKEAGPTMVVVFPHSDTAPEVAAKSKELRELLSLPPEAQEFVLNYSPMRGDGNELTVHSRSMFQIMQAMASYIDVPQEHLDDRRALPGSNSEQTDSGRGRIVIHSGREKPADSFTAVEYREHWFWIDDTDWQTKRALGAIVFIFSLAETSGGDKLPLITIPAQ